MHSPLCPIKIVWPRKGLHLHFNEADFQDNGQIIYKIIDLLSEPEYSEYTSSNDLTFPA